MDSTENIIDKNVVVSIIIPCYNHEKYIKRTLNSVLEDTYPNKEIVIINDGSKDSSDIQINEWIQANQQGIAVTYINRENRGICSTINEMIELARGKYILPLASDDCLFGNSIAKRVQILENTPNKYVLLNDAFVIDEDDKIISQSSSTDYWKADKNLYLNDDDILEECIKGPKIGGPVIFYNKAIFNEIGKFPEGLQIEDWYFYQRAASKKRILFVDFKVALYRLHSNNFSGVNTTQAKKLATAILKVYLLNFKFYPGIKYKFLALKCFMKNLVWYAKLSLKIK
jgi:alpha-1,3-rhamnosyltransferase